MLAEIYNWFTEGFDTADLEDAKVMLEELVNVGRSFDSASRFCSMKSYNWCAELRVTRRKVRRSQSFSKE